MNRFSCTLCVTASTAIAGLLLGCSSYDSSSTVARGPAGFGLGSVTSVQSGNSVTKDGDTLALDCIEPLLVSVVPDVVDGSMGDFLLAPPGGCGSTVDCGWLVLTVRDKDDKALLRVPTAASPIRVDVPVEVITEDKKETLDYHRDETVTFFLELRDSNGVAVMTDEEEPLSTELTVTLSTNSTCNTNE